MAAEVRDLNVECQKTKKLLQTSQSSGRTLLDSFNTDPAYSWGNKNEQADGCLAKALEEISNSMSSFASEYLMNPFAILQKRYGNEFLKNELTVFKQKQTEVDKLSKLVAKLLRMHAGSKDE